MVIPNDLESITVELLKTVLDTRKKVATITGNQMSIDEKRLYKFIKDSQHDFSEQLGFFESIKKDENVHGY